MRGYKLELLDDAECWGIVKTEDDSDVANSGVTRNGIEDALNWIRVQENLVRSRG